MMPQFRQIRLGTAQHGWPFTCLGYRRSPTLGQVLLSWLIWELRALSHQQRCSLEAKPAHSRQHGARSFKCHPSRWQCLAQSTEHFKVWLPCLLWVSSSIQAICQFPFPLPVPKLSTDGRYTTWGAQTEYSTIIICGELVVSTDGQTNAVTRKSLNQVARYTFPFLLLSIQISSLNINFLNVIYYTHDPGRMAGCLYSFSLVLYFLVLFLST